METLNNPEIKSSNERFSFILQTWLPYVRLLWRERKRLSIILCSEFVLIIAFVYFFAKPYYESEITILPEYGNKATLGNLSGLAAMAGISIGQLSPTEIYQDILLSESVIGPVIDKKYLTEKFGDSVNLIQYFKIEPESNIPPQLRERRMFLIIYNNFTKTILKTNLDNITKILEIRITMPESKLSAEVINSLAESLDSYVRTKRKSFASNQRFYLEKRVQEVQDSLAQAEEKFRSFNENNIARGYIPRLALEGSRLSRNIDIFQTVDAELIRQLELAKLEEIKDVPIVDIKELASEPVVKKGPKRVLYCIILMLFTSVLTGAYYISRNKIYLHIYEVRKFIHRITA